ncbi:hypothetical protein DXV75_12165 [Alteromonas aestuariivivens]|uniref:Uncharacterized protein n=1 Tax=Alteromonas aestuariivivens TaxID=1938339 RepID=A0A3D8M565_9ALTE|nr:hypothetical protein [Alteromonas aestuariivivens]RDV24829.1 hypothetical protein DXV75_12165 [Alteromonas aestuariivivens]
MRAGISRFTQIGEWIFEVKMVRALRVSEYGQPYSGVATISINGDNVYIDTQLTRNNEELSREDCMAFYEFCRQLEMKQIHYDRVKQGMRWPRVVDVEENQSPRPRIQLVK